MELIYVELDRKVIAQHLQKTGAEKGDLPLDTALPLPYVLRESDPLAGSSGETLNWDAIVDGILYVALYEPKHEHLGYYRDFLLALEPELPHILQDRLRDQYVEQLWDYARDTIHILLFLLPQEDWPLLELCYSYEQKAEQALQQQRFEACLESLNSAALGYKQVLERDDLSAKFYYQLGYYYLQCWDYPAAYQAFVSAQQLALSPEHPLWGQSHTWLQRLKCLEYVDKASVLSWSRILEDLQQVRDDPCAKALWLEPLRHLDALLEKTPDSGFLWYMRGICLLYGQEMAQIQGSQAISQALGQAQSLGWTGPLEWQLPYYLGVGHYLEGCYGKAEHCFLEVLQKNTEHCATLYWLEKLYGEREDPRSNQYLAVLQSLNPQFPDLLQYFQ